MDMFGSQFSYVGVELQLSYVITTCTYCDYVYTLRCIAACFKIC